MTITLSKRQIKAADRMGGAELLLPWPPELGDPGRLADDSERPATDAERAWVMQHVQPACLAAGLVAGRTMVARVHGPLPYRTTEGPQWQTRLAVLIIGQRWVGAGGQGFNPIRRPLWYGTP
jgi:hypothetical protein